MGVLWPSHTRTATTAISAISKSRRSQWLPMKYIFCGHTYIIDCTGCLHKYLIHSHWLHRDLTAISATTLQLWRFLCLAISLRPLRPYYDHCEFSATARRSFLLHFGRRGFLSMSKTLGDHSAISAIIAILLQPYCDLTTTSRRPWRFWRSQRSQS